MNIREAAAKLDLSPATIRRWIKTGRLEATLIDGAYGEEYSITDEALEQAKEQGNTPIVVSNMTDSHALERAIKQVVGDTMAKEIQSLRDELEDTRQALEKAREADRERQEQRDRQLLKVMRDMQERQRQEQRPLWKRIFNK